MSLENLPVEWEKSYLDDVIHVIRGITYKKQDASDIKLEKHLPVLRANSIQNGQILLDDLVYINSDLINDDQLIKKHDILVAMSSGSKNLVGKSAIAKEDIDAGFGAFCAILRPYKLLEPKYIGLFTFSVEYRNKISELSAGANINNLKPSHFSEIPFPIPPLAEQQEIVRQLDIMLAQGEQIKARLDAIPAILKKFRQSVLADAVSGKLTEEWRSNKKLEKAFAEVQELHNFKGKLLNDLPGSWQWVRFDSVANIASNLKDPLLTPNAIHLAPNHIESKTGKVIEISTIAQDNVTSAKHEFVKGQIVYSKIRPYLAKVVIADFDGLCSADMYPIDSKIHTEYLYYWMLTAQFTDWASNAESRSVLPKINQKDLSVIPVPHPPMEEQKEIASKIKEYYQHAYNILAIITVAQKRVNLLTQSILAKAFSGELTTEWREQHQELITGINSAESLLAAIQAEREASKPAKKTRKKKEV